MKKALRFGLITMVTGAALFAQSAVILEHCNPSTGRYQVTYEIQVNRGRAQELVFPSNGILSPDAPMQVLAVIDRETGESLDHEMLPMTDPSGKTVEGRYVIHTKFSQQNTESTSLLIEYKLILFNKEDCSIAENGEWLLRYETSQDVIFVLPEGHSASHSNVPVLIDTRDGRCMLFQNRPDDLRSGQTRTLLFRTSEVRTAPVKWWQTRVIKL